MEEVDVLEMLRGHLHEKGHHSVTIEGYGDDWHRIYINVVGLRMIEVYFYEETVEVGISARFDRPSRKRCSMDFNLHEPDSIERLEKTIAAWKQEIIDEENHGS